MDKSHPVPGTELQCPSGTGDAAGQGMLWDRECCGITHLSNARHSAGGARGLHGMDLLGAAGELRMCGSKEELCLQLLWMCVSVCVHYCHPQKHQHPVGWDPGSRWIPWSTTGATAQNDFRLGRDGSVLAPAPLWGSLPEVPAAETWVYQA